MSYSTEFKNIEIYSQNFYKPAFSFNDKPFYYVVPMFPYPSGNIHMGHIRNYTISSVIARYKEMKGFNVFHPMGFDSFGLPAEIAAIKHKVTPQQWTQKNIETMIGDFESVGFDFNWENTVKTHEFNYYKFEQDIFKKAFKEGLIYKKDKYVNYDPVDKTILSNEQVHAGKGWRSGADVIRKKMPMYFFNMKKYAQQLHDGLKDLDWPKKVVEMQKNWIGIVQGQEHQFTFKDFVLNAFQAEKDKDVNILIVGINNDFIDFIKENVKFKDWLENATKGSVSGKNNFNAKNWFDTGYQVNYENKNIPVYIDINKDTESVFIKDNTIPKQDIYEIGVFSGSKTHTNIGLKDWCISRQRYWGNPIPMISCNDCGDIPSDGYVKLPDDLMPDGEGNILDKTKDFTDCICPQCHKKAIRCTDTMDTFVQSSWYYHRYLDNSSEKMIPNPNIQIDTYIGGVEHATMHLIYTRFFHKMLRDFGMVNTDEPIKKLITQGMVCKKYIKEDGTIASAKMSKSLGNVVAPKEYIDKYGADSLQMFMIFSAPPNDNFDFDDAGIVGTYRFLDEIYRYFFESNNSTKNMNDKEAQEAVKKLKIYITQEFEGRGNLNTIVPQLMIAFKCIKKTQFHDTTIKHEVEKDFIEQLNIFAPKLAKYVNDFVLNKQNKIKPQII